MIEALLVVDEKRGRLLRLERRQALELAARACFSATLRATTWLTGSRARISSRRYGWKRMGARKASIEASRMRGAQQFATRLNR